MVAKTRRVRKGLLQSDSIVFFDDDFDRNIHPFRKKLPKIKSIHVSRDHAYRQILKGRPDFYYPIMYSRKYRTNRYAQKIVKDLSLDRSINLCERCRDLTNQGISISQIKQVIQWANFKQKTTKRRMILFDLDNTLAVCNLIMNTDCIKQSEKDDKFSPREIAQYIAGTKSRFEALLLMFFNLRKNDIVCKILSNNGWTNTRFEGFPFFLKIMQIFDPGMTEHDIIYGHMDKVDVFKKNPELMKIYNETK
jgi:hypothetical protein